MNPLIVFLLSSLLILVGSLRNTVRAEEYRSESPVSESPVSESPVTEPESYVDDESGNLSPSVIIPVISPNSDALVTDENTNANTHLTQENLPESNSSEVIGPWLDSIDSGRFSENESTGSTDSSTVDANDVPVVLGQPSNAPFVVAIPGSREDRLEQLQELVPTAFLTDSRRGRYIQAGAFSSRSNAEALSSFLRHQGFDARVVYFRVTKQFYGK
ncbi:MAG: SPOR domain-containing protein [Leptolyngbyaceae bacterium]|nr:SPOR domain-containing protein [Leptolyngbyaceae bacterium]